MSRMIEPRQPADGWHKRWVVQAWELMWRAGPPLLIGLIVCGLVQGVVFQLTTAEVSGPWSSMVMLRLHLGSLIFVVFTIYATHCIARADGVDPAQSMFSSETITAIGWSFVTPFIVGSLLMMPIVAGGMPAFPLTPMRNVLVAVWSLGATLSLTMMMISSASIWIPLQVCMGVRFGEYSIHLASATLRKAFTPTMALMMAYAFIPFITVTSVPFGIGCIAALLMLAVAYVGSREIYAGIDQNGTPARAVSIEMAPVRS